MLAPVWTLELGLLALNGCGGLLVLSAHPALQKPLGVNL